MIFGPTSLDDAAGAILAHSLRAGAVTLKKGRILTADDVAALRDAGWSHVVAARLEAGDVGEDRAAGALAAAACGEGLVPSRAATGRCNLIAERRGLIVYEADRLHRVNGIDEGITLAALRSHEIVEPGQIVATVKIIPFAVPARAFERAQTALHSPRPLLSMAPFVVRRVGLVSTHLPGQKAGLREKTHRVLDARLAALDCPPATAAECAHEAEAVARCVEDLVATGCEIVLISGASATVDRRDVVPAAMERVGGTIEHFGMPVDPGNLTVFGRWRDVPLVGLPGCARSPKLNGVDWVLQRLVAGVNVGPHEVTRLGAGGLLQDSGERPLPRTAAVADPSEPAKQGPRVAALVLAAGRSRRWGARNKLLAEVDGVPMVRHAVAAAVASRADPVIVVLGHERDRVAAALDGCAVTMVDNPDHAAGLSASLHRGLAALPAEADGVVVLLGDMPRVTARIVDRLIAAFDPAQGRAICVPTCDGKRGNPVLFARRFFAEMQAISGDVGARALLGAYPDTVHEVVVPDDGILHDVDDPRSLAEVSRRD